MHEPEGQRNGLIAASALISGLLLIVVFVAGNAYFQQVKYETEYRQYLSVGNPELETLRTEENTLLHSYVWVDREAGVVRIPIERAMELVAEESGGTNGSGGR